MRRIRTGVLTLNGHGHYVMYAVDYSLPERRSALWITAGPSCGFWRFDY